MERQTIVRKAGRRVQRSGESVAHGAAWFSIALGVVELVAPHAVARIAGLRPGSSHVVRLCGIREIATGIGLLRARNAAPWLWGRVAGDLLDAGIVTTLADKHSVAPVAKAVSAVAAVGAITSVDAFAAHHYKQPARGVAPWEDYSDRSGFPGGVETARGAARGATAPADTLTPPALRPWQDGQPVEAGAGSAADPTKAVASGGTRPTGVAKPSDGTPKAPEGPVRAAGDSGSAARLGDAPPRPGDTQPQSPAKRPEGGSPPPSRPGDGVTSPAKPRG